MFSVPHQRVALAIVLSAAMGGCATAAQRKVAENATIQKQASEEVKRVCALPEPERQAEIEKINQSDFELYCSKP